MDPFVVHSATAFAMAAQDAQVRSIVELSQWLANPASPSLLTRGHWLIDRMFARMSGTTLTIVNPGFFADNILSQTIGMAANLGQYPWPYGESRNAWPSNEDIARVAVAALLNPERHDRRIYRPTGPRLMSGRDIAETLSGVLERPVTLMHMSEWMFAKALRAAGFPPFMHCMRTRRDAAPRYSSASGAAPGLDFDRFARAADLPAAPSPRLSVGDERLPNRPLRQAANQPFHLFDERSSCA
jgi:uncharacterized protein YbjT (DUF2867 family)